MGTAIIQSYLGGGKYRVRLQFDNAIIQQRIANIDARLAEITAKLAELATEKATAKTKLDADVLALNVYIDATPPQDYAANPTQIDKLTAALYESKSAYDLIVSHENREKLQKAGLEKDKTYLAKYCPAEITTDIWCVQLIGNLTGTIKTIECDYGLERDPDTNVIKFDTGCWLPYQATPPDSKLQHPFASSQHANWFNLSMLPAAQRDKARYRVATLLNVTTGRIQFDGQYNTQEHTDRLFNHSPIFPVIGGAQREFYDGAQLYYPCIDNDLYLNGDRVIVDLHNGVGVPTVIGWYSNPRECVSAPAPSYLYLPINIYVVPAGSVPNRYSWGSDYSNHETIDIYYVIQYTLSQATCQALDLPYPTIIASYPETFLMSLPAHYAYWITHEPTIGPQTEGLWTYALSMWRNSIPDGNDEDEKFMPSFQEVTLTLGGGFDLDGKHYSSILYTDEAGGGFKMKFVTFD